MDVNIIFKKNKKGISPLIATVLLIGFAVALAAVVMTWGLDFIKTTADTTTEQSTRTLVCASELQFEISAVDCYDDSNPAAIVPGKISIDNRGQIDITQVILRIHDSADNVVSIDTSTVIDPVTNLTLGGINKFAVKSFMALEINSALNVSIGPKIVQAIATVKGEEGEEDITCPQNLQEFYVSC
tara:strand:+ start:1729 stop:2283 length:555 start_codon:yes stop_codon:yes gene_type:complete